jgi:GNAT superfamily N-acetyltransferase
MRLVRAFGVEEDRAYDDGHLLGALDPLLADDALGQVWLACSEDDEPVGYAVLTWGWGLESGGREGLLDEIFIDRGRRGDGLGGRLLEHVITAARVAGCRTFFLETERPNDAARRLYRRYGLVEEDSIWMRSEL